MREGTTMELPEVTQESELPVVENVREVEQAELYERLERRADVVTELKQKVSSTGPEMNPTDFDALIDGEMDRLTETFSEEAKRVAERASTIRGKIVGLNPNDPHEAYKIKKISDEFEQTLRSNEDGAFLVNLQDTAVFLKGKHAHINEAYYNPAAARKMISEALRTDTLQETDWQEIRYDGIHAAVIMEKEKFIELVRNPSAAGAHLMGTPVSVIRQDLDGMENSIRHESVHNMLDWAKDIKTHSRGYVERMFAYLNIPNNNQALRRSILNKIQHLRAEDILDEFHHEFLAGLEQVERLAFPAITSKKELKGALDAFDFYSDLYATAGVDGRGLVAELIKFDQESEDRALGEMAGRLGVRFAQKFGQTVEIMRQAVVRAEKISPEANERVHALFMVLPPSKYRHIPKYLDYAYGTEEAVN